MKSIQKIAITIIAVITFQSSYAGNAPWPEMQAFHTVMAKTFHPAEDGNIQPVKDNADLLLAKAKAWQASTVPAGYKKDETTKVLATLVAKCEEIQKSVKSKSTDDELKKLITEAHETFHQIAEKCRAPETDKK